MDLLLIAAIAAVVVAPVALNIARRQFDPFEPLVLFSLAYGMMFVARPAAMLATDSLVFVGPQRDLDISSTFTEMLAVALTGALAFVAGYSLQARQSLAMSRRAPPRRLDDRRLTALALLLGAVGVSAFALFLVLINGFDTLIAIFMSGRSADIEDAVRRYRYLWLLFLVLVPAAMVLLALSLKSGSRLLLIAFVVLAGVVLLRVVPLGNRLVLLPFLGGIFVFLYLRRGCRPSMRTLAVVALVAVVGSAFLSDLRGRETRAETFAETVRHAVNPSRLTHLILVGPDTEMAPALAAALSVIPEEIPRGFGTVLFGDLILRPLPRPLWDGKPLPPRERVVQAVWPVEYARQSMNPEFSVLLYFYWDFGLLGVMLGLAVYGIGARYLYQRYRLHQTYLSSQLIYSLSLWFLVIALRDSPVDTLVRAAFMIGPLWIILRLAHRRDHHPRERVGHVAGVAT